MTKRQRLITYVIVIIGFATILVTWMFLKRQVTEQLLIWKLNSNDPDELYDAEQALGKMKSVKAIPRLMDLMREQSGTEGGAYYYGSFFALVEIGNPAVPELIGALKDENQIVRMNAVHALWRIENESGNLNEDVVNVILAKINDESDIVRREVARALGNFGLKAEKAIPELVRVSKDNDQQVRNNAAEALRKILSITERSVQKSYPHENGGWKRE